LSSSNPLIISGVIRQLKKKEEVATAACDAAPSRNCNQQAGNQSCGANAESTKEASEKWTSYLRNSIKNVIASAKGTSVSSI
jgi:hypothetical protein